MKLTFSNLLRLTRSVTPLLPTQLVASLLTLLFASSGLMTAHAQAIYRCGNEYTNNISSAKAKGCELISGSNISIVHNSKPKRASSYVPRAPRNNPPLAHLNDQLPAVASNATYIPEQRQKDSNARAILESEFRITQSKHDALTLEFNKGAPEKLPSEANNPGKYQERVTQMKSAIDRLAGDMTSLRKEISRFSSSN